jgi:hypothetical protein
LIVRTNSLRNKRARIMKRLVWAVSSLLLVFASSSCGTLAFQSRQGQGNTGRVDPNVVIMDSLGFLFFVVPGVVAFTVDICTNAIYLPPSVAKGEGPFISDPPETKASMSVRN